MVSTEVTILLADIRGFTALLSAYPPTLMVDLLNRFFAAMCDAVEGYGGRLDKFTVIDTPAHRQLKALVDDRLWHR